MLDLDMEYISSCISIINQCLLVIIFYVLSKE